MSTTKIDSDDVSVCDDCMDLLRTRPEPCWGVCECCGKFTMVIDVAVSRQRSEGCDGTESCICDECDMSCYA